MERIIPICCMCLAESRKKENGLMWPYTIKKQPTVYPIHERLLNACAPPLFLSARPLGGNGEVTQKHAIVRRIPSKRAVQRTAAGNPRFSIKSVTMKGKTTPPRVLLATKTHYNHIFYSLYDHVLTDAATACHQPSC